MANAFTSLDKKKKSNAKSNDISWKCFCSSSLACVFYCLLNIYFFYQRIYKCNGLLTKMSFNSGREQIRLSSTRSPQSSSKIEFNFSDFLLIQSFFCMIIFFIDFLQKNFSYSDFAASLSRLRGCKETKVRSSILFSSKFSPFKQRRKLQDTNLTLV